MSVCVCLCSHVCSCLCWHVCVQDVGIKIWTFQCYCLRFSARPSGKRAEGLSLREQENSVIQQSLSQFPAFLSPDSGMAGMHLCGLAEATKPGKQVHL